jgi:pimeloyl-ACP methyl ester carboxylesterase
MWPKTYALEMDAAWARVHAIPTEHIETRFGDIEYAHHGSGMPVLHSHGIFAGHVGGLTWTRLFFDPQLRAIVPSRFGYFGSTMPKGASPDDQADGFALLLDHLGVERAVIAGFSAGAPPALNFALRHADRTAGLVLHCARLPGVPPRLYLKPFLSALFGSQRAMWAIKRYRPRTFHTLMGVPKSYALTDPKDVAMVADTIEDLFPTAPKTKGVIFDTFVSNVAVDRYRLEDLAVPTLIVHAADDELAPYPTAVNAVPRIPGAQFVTIESGGHLFLGHHQRVHDVTGAFVHQVTNSNGA